MNQYYQKKLLLYENIIKKNFCYMNQYYKKKFVI